MFVALRGRVECAVLQGLGDECLYLGLCLGIGIGG